MSLRRLSVLVAHLPPGSATWAAQHGIPGGVDLTAVVLMDVYHALTGEEHPARPKPRATSGASRAADLRERLRAQRDRLASPTT